MNHRPAFTLLLLSAAAYGCAFLTPKHSLKPQLDEVQAIKSSLDAEWDKAKASFEETVAEMEAFSAQGVDSSKMDVRLVRESILGGEESGEAARRAVEAVSEGETIDLEVVETTDRTIALGQKIQANLSEAIPGLLSGFSDRLTESGTEIARIGVEAETMREVVEENVLMSTTEKQEFYTDHEALKSELTSMQGILGKMLEDSTELGVRLTAAQAKFETELDTAFGR